MISGGGQSTAYEDLAPISPQDEDELEREHYRQVKANMSRVQLVLGLILLTNLAVAGSKVVLGLLTKSSSLTADGIHSISDGLSNVAGIIAIYFALRPNDTDHPYGHQKIEMLAGAGIGLLLFVMGFRLIAEAIGHLSDPVMPIYTYWSLLILIITLFINIFVTVYEHRMGKMLNSPILISDAAHTKSDVFISLGVLCGLIGMKLGLPPILDPIITILVALFIFRSAWSIFQQNTNVLLDAQALDTDLIRRKVLSFEEVRDVHKIRSRGPISKPFIDMHLIVDPELKVVEIHRLEHKIESYFRQLLDSQVEILIHYEPDLKGKS